MKTQTPSIGISETRTQYRVFDVPLVFTAPILVAHQLAWDVPGFWEGQPLAVGERKDKVAVLTKEQRALLQKLDIPVDETLSVEAEAHLRGHWLPDGRPGFPASGFLGAVGTAVVQYKGKSRDSLNKKTVLGALALLGDESAPDLVAFDAPSPYRIVQDIGRNSGMTGAPRLITRLEFPKGTRVTLRARCVPSLLNEQQVAQVIAWGGDFGIGQRRPGSPKGGGFGTWQIATAVRSG